MKAIAFSGLPRKGLMDMRILAILFLTWAAAAQAEPPPTRATSRVPRLLLRKKIAHVTGGSNLGDEIHALMPIVGHLRGWGQWYRALSLSRSSSNSALIWFRVPV